MARCKEALVGPGRVFEPVEVDLDIESLGPRGLSSPSRVAVRKIIGDYTCVSPFSITKLLVSKTYFWL